MFLISWFLFSTLHLKSYYSFLKHSKMESFSGFLLLSIAYDQNWKDPWQKRWEFWENFLLEHLYLFFGILKNMWLLVDINNPAYFAKLSKTGCISAPTLKKHSFTDALQNRYTKKKKCKIHRKKSVLVSLFNKAADLATF